MKVRFNSLMLGTLAVATLLLPATAGAELHSRSKDIVVMEARDLPEIVQLPGDSLFLHADNQGSTYLYIEQQRGKRLSVLGVTDPAHIRVASTAKLETSGIFDFVGALNRRAELIRFRNDHHTAILDLHHADRPQIEAADGLNDLQLTENL